MGIQVNITNVNKESRIISFNQDGQDRTAEIISPARIDFARLGKAEIGLTQEGKVNFVKSLEPKSSNTQSYNKEKQFKAYNEVQLSEGVTLKEFQEIYNRINQGHMKINATNILNARLSEGKHLVDVVYFVTRFEKINSNDNTI